MTYSKLNKKIIWSWIISRLILLIILTTALLGTKFMIVDSVTELNWLINLIVITLIVLLTLNAIAYPFFQFNRWKYCITEDKIEIVKGLFFTTTTIIPIIKIQHVSINQGPINKLFKLTKVTVNTAGGIHEIVGLTNSEAQDITDYLNSKVITKFRKKEENSPVQKELSNG